MSYKIIFLLLITMMQFNQVQASDDRNDEFCSISGLTNCLNITKNKCIEAHMKSDSICLKKFPLETDFENEKILYETVKKYGDCHTDNFLIFIDSNVKKLSYCIKQTQPFLQIESNAEKD